MPPSAYALVVTFAIVSVLAGILAARVVGPWRPWAALVPALAGFGALYVVGHRLAIGLGPTVTLFGWEVWLPFDVAVALVVALGAAGLQRLALGLLQAQQQGPGRDRLA